MYTYSRKTLSLTLVVLMVGVPAVVMAVLVGTFAFVAWQCELPMDVRTYPWDFILLGTALGFVVGALNACAEVSEYRFAKRLDRERAAREARLHWNDWDEALYACEVMTTTRNRY